MVEEILGEVYIDDPVESAVPPVAAAYQSIACPLPGVAEIVKDPVEHLEAPLPIGAEGMSLTVAVTAVLE